MRKKLAILVVGIALIAAGMFASGYRLALDGSGTFPRFLTKVDFDALEADRARQKQAAAASSPAAESASVAGARCRKSRGQPAKPNRTRPRHRCAASLSGPTSAALTATAATPPAQFAQIWPREGLPQLWKQPVGGGYASFVVADGRAFTIEQRRDREVVAAYDVQNGRELWTNGWPANFQEGMGGDGPRATPTYHDGRIYALGAEGELRVLDAAKGTLVWRRNILTENDANNLAWGMSASPLIVDDKVIVLPGGTRGSSVVAYNKATGDVVWKSLNDEQAYTSPMLVTLGGLRQILVVSAYARDGLDGR